MRTIHKYIVNNSPMSVQTYERARFLHVAGQRELITVWAEVNTLERECLRTLHIAGTGTVAPPGEYIGTAIVQGGDFVFHVYAEPESHAR